MGRCYNNNTNILFWNARGIQNKKTEFFNYLEANNIPIALLNETHLHPSTKFKCPNYCVYRSDREGGPGGGTAILIRIEIKHSEIFLHKLQHMEATAIQLIINKELITLFSIYNPPGKIIERDLDLLLQTGNKVILAGDFNAKHFTWHSRNNNRARRVLLSHYNNNEYLITATVRPTHVPDGNPGGADVLDLAILHNIVSTYN
jgi:exonuclease III